MLDRVLLCVPCLLPLVAPLPAQMERTTEAQARAFAKDLIEALTSGQRASVDRLFDWGEFQKICLGPLGTVVQRKAYMLRAQQSLFENGFLAQMMQAARTTRVRLMRIHSRRGYRRVLIRIIAGAGVTYYDFVLNTTRRGTRASDFKLVHTGRFLSELLRENFLQIQPNSRGFLSLLLGGKSKAGFDLAQVAPLSRALRAGRFKEVLAGIAGLPAAVQSERIVLAMRVQAAGRVGGQAYTEALSAYRAALPSDPSVDFQSIDFHFTRKEWTQAIAAVDRIDKMVGGDPYLDVLRANIVATKGDLPKAREHALAARAAEPTLLQALQSLITVDLRAKRYAETIEWVVALAKARGVPVANLLGLPLFAELRRSRAYAEWRRKQQESVR